MPGPSRSAPRPGPRRAAGARGQDTAQQALERARQHLRNAAAEALAAARALLDAASLATVGEGAETNRALGIVARGIDELADGLAGSGPPVSGPLIDAILAALDGEIARWEAQARDDTEARAVLRAFLGLREILWEFGLRPSAAAGARPDAGSASARPAAPRSAASRSEEDRSDAPSTAPAQGPDEDDTTSRRPAAAPGTTPGESTQQGKQKARRAPPRVQRIEIH